MLKRKNSGNYWLKLLLPLGLSLVLGACNDFRDSGDDASESETMRNIIDPCVDPNAPGCGNRRYDNVRYSCIQVFGACMDQGRTAPVPALSRARRYSHTECRPNDSRYPHLNNVVMQRDFWTGTPFQCNDARFRVCQNSGSSCNIGLVKILYTQIN